MNNVDLRESAGTFSALSDQLWWETKPSCREGLRGLLLKEEDRFGVGAECLEAVERNLVRGAELITRQRRLLTETINDAEREAGERLLRNIETIQAIFEDFRALILHALERDG